MKRSAPFALAALIIVFGLAYVPAAHAQASEWTVWSISEPTQVGEVVLDPGTYRLSVIRTPTSRNFVRVMSEDGRTLYTTAVTVPHVIAPDEEVPEAATFVYYPAIEGQPRVLRTWFATAPPGAVGHDFVYEEDFATRLAAASKAPVVSYRGRVAEADLGTTELHVVTPEAHVDTYVVPETTTVVETERTTMPVEAPRMTLTETRTAPVAVAEARTDLDEDRDMLPQTAGSAPLLALLGALAIAGAFTLRALNR